MDKLDFIEVKNYYALKDIKREKNNLQNGRDYFHIVYLIRVLNTVMERIVPFII